MAKKMAYLVFATFLNITLSAFAAEVASAYDPKIFYGEPKIDASGQKYIDENPSQTHSKDHYVMIRIKNIETRPGDKEIGRIRVAVWDREEIYAKEGVRPFRASSTWAKEVTNKEIVIKISGLTPGKEYSFFAHFDKGNTGKIHRNFLGIPTDPYIFSNKQMNHAPAAGLKRKGFGPPSFADTLIKYVKPGQEIVLTL